MRVDALSNGGIDYNSGVARFMGDAALYEQVLVAFLDDPNMDRARAAFAERDYKRLFAPVHTLKGACGNVDLVDMYHCSRVLSDLLRQEPYDETAIAEAFAALEQAYVRASEAIKRAL